MILAVFSSRRNRSVEAFFSFTWNSGREGCKLDQLSGEGSQAMHRLRRRLNGIILPSPSTIECMEGHKAASWTADRRAAFYRFPRPA